MTDTTIKAAPAQLLVNTMQTSLVRLVLARCVSPNTRSSYRKSISDLSDFLDGRPFTPMLLLEWRRLLADHHASSTVNLRLSAVKALVREAVRTRALAAEVGNELLSVAGVPRRGARKGNWLTVDQLRLLLSQPDRETRRGRRNYCILAMLAGCAIRRQELADLDVERIGKRDGRWVLSDLPGKGGRVRTVAVPTWVKAAVDAWTSEAGIRTGRLVRQISADPRGLSSYSIWETVTRAAASVGIGTITPHDLRRTCAKLCRKAGGELEQIQFMLGHASIQTTERYLGSEQDLVRAVNDDFGL